MERRFEVNIPWKRVLKSRAEIRMGAHRLLKEIDKGIYSTTKLSEATEETPEFTKKCLRHLEEIGEIRIDRKSRSHRIVPGKGAS